MATTPPAETSSLLVPIHLDAWVIDSQSQQLMSIYRADYTRLPQFLSLLDPPFSPATVKKTPGVHLHWALPDALTHGRTPATGSDETIFPLVPNRWLIARFNATDVAWQCKLWVVQSDYIGGSVGKTSDPLQGASETIVKLKAPGSQLKISAGDKLQILSPDGTFAAEVEAKDPAAKDATSINIRPYDFSKIEDGLAAGSSVRLLASSAFLDPGDPTVMQVARDGTASFDVNHASIGKRHDIASWQAVGGADGGPLFLQAVGPGNVSFAAYKPTVNNVFSFTDTDLPEEGKGVFNYTYMIVGWYSDPAKGDPLRGVTVYDPAVWGAREDWQKQTPEQRMATLLSYLKWSVKDQNGKSVAAPPLSTSLYHGLVASVQWPPPPVTPTQDPGKIDRKNVHVAVGNTAADALAALVQLEARARAASDPSKASQWTTAGDTLSQLMQAAMYDLLDKYDQPGGAALVEQQIEQAWFGLAPGGTIWEVVAGTSQSSQQTAEPPELMPAQSAAVAAALAGLNSTQTAFDESVRALMSLQSQLYLMWWKLGRAESYSIYDTAPPTRPRWSVLNNFIRTLYPPLLKETWNRYCAVEQARKTLPDPTADDTDPRSPARWAEANPAWLFPDAAGTPKKLKLAELGLYLKASAMPNFAHPNDPVMMVSGLNRTQRHGEDGRYNEDGTLTCRVPGQSITGLNVQGQPAINVQTVTTGGVNLGPCSSFASIPNVPSLIAEAFFVDPANAPVIAKAIAGSDVAKIKTAITSLLAEKPAAGTSWTGTPPTPFSVEAWDQAWSPLFLEWKMWYYPTGPQKFVFSLTDWQFDGSHYAWLGTNFRSDTFVEYKGRTLLTPYAPLTFKAKIEKYLAGHTAIASDQLKALISTVAGWDVLSQNLSGLTDQFITLISQETFPPPANDDNKTVQCPPGDKQPDVATLIGNQYHSVPIVETTEPRTFFPVRAGFGEFTALQIVDAFGQRYGGNDISFWNNTPQGFQPTLGQGLGLSVASTLSPQKAQDALKLLQSTSARFQLPPRLVQSARLDLDFLANDGSKKPAVVSSDPNPVCGWLVPNHLDGGISVYDEKGAPLGELLALPPGSNCDNWRPRPGSPGTKPPPTCPRDIPNVALRSVVESIAAQSSDTFRDLLNTIDETLWMVDPLGGRKDQFLSVLIGRPLAVVQLRLKLSLLGDPAFNQFWNRTCTPQEATQASQCTQLKDTGGVLDVEFPLRLGSLELRDDGLIGYYLSSENFAHFYTVHYPDKVAAGDKYLRRIIDPAPPTGGQPYQGNISLKCNGDGVTVTMLVDPRGRIHAYSGILPVVSTALPGQLVEDFIRGLQVTFRTGPVVADPSTMRIPQPAEEQGVWSWVQATGSQGTTWIEQTIVNADDQARMPDAQLQLREGWLKLSDLKEPRR